MTLSLTPTVLARDRIALKVAPEVSDLNFSAGIQVSGVAVPALSFAVWTAANLIPRAVSHHAWYRRTFPDYPSDRRAVIPALL